MAHAQSQDAVSISASADATSATATFRWSRPTEYKLTESGTLVLIAFSRTVMADIAGLAQSFGTIASEVRKTGGGRVILIRLKEPMKATVNRSADGRTIVLRMRSTRPTTVQTVKLGMTDSRAFRRLVFKWERAVDYRLAAEKQKATIFFSNAGRLDQASVADTLKKAGITIVFRRVGSRTVATLTFAAPVRLRANGQGDVFTLDVFPETPGNTSGTKPATGDPLLASVAVERRGQAMKVTINWPARVSAASFRYGGFVWVVFGAVAKIDLGEVQKNLAPGVEDVEITALDNATIMRFRASNRIAARLTAEGWQWAVTLGPNDGKPRTNMFIFSEPDASNGGRVVVRTGSASAMLTIEDPVVGVPLVIVPVSAPGMGVAARRRYAKFTILPSSQGLVIIPKADEISVDPVAGGIAVTSRQGLALGGAAKSQ